jgi:dihydrofolate reductase
MRSLVYFVACTVDGYIAAQDGALDAFAFEGPQVRDLLDEFPEMLPGHLRDAVGPLGPNRRFDTVLMGRGTYEVGLLAGVTSPYPHLRQLVVSATMTERPDPEVELVREGVVERVRALKAEAGADVWLCGGAGLAATLADEIDELILKVSPIVLGSGIPLFAGAVGPRALAVTEHRTYPDGFALLRGRLGRRASP